MYINIKTMMHVPLVCARTVEKLFRIFFATLSLNNSFGDDTGVYVI